MDCPQPTSLNAKRRTRYVPIVTVPMFLWMVATAVSGCVYDSKNPCGAHQINYLDGARCVCEPNAVWTATGCIPCGKNEVPGTETCVCTAGFTRASAAAACEPTPSGLGNACDAATPCPDPNATHCEMGTATAGYCTKTDCTTTADCAGGYACDTRVTPTLCRRPPVGYGKACSSPEECAGTEATFCDSVMAKACIVEGCSMTNNDCFVGQVCCDLSKFGVPKPICVPEGGCP